METNEKNLKKLEKLLSLMDEESLSKEDFATAFENVVKQIKKLEERNMAEFEMIKNTFKSFSNKLSGDNSLTLAEIKAEVKKTVDNYILQVSEKYGIMEEELNRRASEIKDGKDADEDMIVEKVLEKIELPEIKGIEEDLPKLGNPIRDALELLQGDDRLSADAISGLEKYIKNLIKDNMPKQVVGGLRPAGIGIETPTGALNGVNTAYTVNFVPEYITLNGQNIYSGYGYTLSSVAGVLTITLENAPASSDILRSHYKEL